MELIERDAFLAVLQLRLSEIRQGEGHSVFISGEAGIGKTSLVRAFCREQAEEYAVYQGTCDALFTPRPLAPLYDVIWQMNSQLIPGNLEVQDRNHLFMSFFQELSRKKDPFIIVFEDIHWADEATLDFIKFLARRISRLKCLFLLTYRDDAIHPGHPLRNVLGQLSPDSFSHVMLPPLTSEAVKQLAEKKGFNGEEVYHISGGNPFYVNEILASYSPGIPVNIRDSILAVYYRHTQTTQQVWEFLSILPTALDVADLDKLNPLYPGAIENCITAQIVTVEKGQIFFRHELYRRTVEAALSPLLRVTLNKRILELFQDKMFRENKIEQIIHHAKNANEYDTVVKYAPAAAAKAAKVGAHIEASKLYLSAIEYYQGNNENLLIEFYEGYAYECYLINQIKDAIVYTGKALNLWKKKGDTEKMGNAMRFLSRLWWFDGNRKQAESLAMQAIELLEDQPASPAKAMAYSNMSQLKMLSDEAEACISWGEKALAMASALDDQETISHALNNIGAVKAHFSSTLAEGRKQLEESLRIALAHAFHEHAARAYTNLGHILMVGKQVAEARKWIDEGIQYCEQLDLGSWSTYMLACKARVLVDAGDWDDALKIVDLLIKNEHQPKIVLAIAHLVAGLIGARRGTPDALGHLKETHEFGVESGEPVRLLPTQCALLEYECITGALVLEDKEIDSTLKKIGSGEVIFEVYELSFWLERRGRGPRIHAEPYAPYDLSTPKNARLAAAFWKKTGCPYEEAIAMFSGDDEDKKRALAQMQTLGAHAVAEKMKLDMRNSGIKNIPRGMRKATSANPASLTEREVDVLKLLQEGIQNKEIAGRLFISAKTVDHHISSILFKLEVNSRTKAVQEASRLGILK